MLLAGSFRPAETPLDDALLRARRPVLAVGSNASPAQLVRKLGPTAVVPLTLARVDGLAAGVSAHVSHGRYIPAAPIAAPGEQHALFVLWLDDTQLAAVDRTEPNYRRITLGSQFAVSLPDGPVRGCAAYVSRWGCLHHGGVPRRLGPQRDLLAALLAASADLRALFGPTPEAFVAAAADPARREQARELFAAEGWVAAQPELGRQGNG